MLVEGGRKEANLRRALERINEAAGHGAQVVVLPEALTLGWTHPSANSDADEIPDGFSCAELRDAARRKAVYAPVHFGFRLMPQISQIASAISRISHQR